MPATADSQTLFESLNGKDATARFTRSAVLTDICETAALTTVDGLLSVIFATARNNDSSLLSSRERFNNRRRSLLHAFRLLP
jgi:hypothetical protein